MVQQINEGYFLKVAVPAPLNQLFTYAWKAPLNTGLRVLVPFGVRNRPTVGVVLGLVDREQIDVDIKKIKAIVEVLDDEPIYSPSLLELARWLSDYYWYPYGEVLKTMLPSSEKSVKKKSYRLSEAGKLLQKSDESSQDGVFLQHIFGKSLKLGAATVRTKMKKWHGGLEEAEQIWERLGKSKLWLLEETTEVKSRKNISLLGEENGSALQAESPLSLTAAQQQVFDEICRLGLEAPPDQRRPLLLWGVTGAGKTEIYLQLIARVLASEPKSQALVMVPEISLTPQMMRVFEARFPGQVAVVHSAMGDAERWSQLNRIRQGQAKILVGPRSAVFAPFSRLALILVDEEHDASYKQTTGLCYHGRDVAVVRAKIEQALIVLGSATPSMESFWNGKTGKYHLLHLMERVQGRALPSTELIQQKLRRRMGSKLPQKAEDLMADVPISERIIAELKETLAKGEQAMVIVNRRGFAYYIFSLDRQEPIQCPQCSVSLTVHKKSRVLRCHYCDYQTSLSQVQQERQHESLVTVGYGSEQAEDFLKEVLPDARIVRVDSDTVQKKGALAQVLKDFRAGKIDILVGTQMLAKGHDFAKVTLICLLEIDQSLNLPDFRAGERTFQLMVQAAGRAGRGELAGRVLVQCQKPDHPVVLAAMKQDYQEFASLEIGFRQVHGYPPFTRMVMFELNGPDKNRLEAAVNQLKELMARYYEAYGQQAGISILGPAIPPIEIIRGRHRRSMIISSANLAALRRLTGYVREQLNRLPKEVRFKIDIDPQSLL